MTGPDFSREKEQGGERIRLHGDWVLDHVERLEALVNAAEESSGALVLDLSGIGRMDTVGAWLVYRLHRDLCGHGHDCRITGVPDRYQPLMERMQTHDRPTETEEDRPPYFIGLAEEIGYATVTILTGFGELLAFLGLVVARLAGAVVHWRRIRLTPLVHQMEMVGFRALPIVGLISFLIGAVIVNQGAIQLAQFGAEIFVVDMVAIAQLRELGILLTAIIIAGRSGSAFTAQIGSMVLREEVDAMKVIGINPVDVLVLPRLIALVVMLPLLTFFADMIGVTGGMLMAWATLDITPGVFIQRFREAIVLSTFLVGLIKAPFFAVVISVSGCFEGLKVRGSAESVGRHTTKSVVQSIFLVIVLDALFAIFFTAIDF